MAELFAYTDGACSGNPGPGGWGALLVAREGETVLKTRELSGGAAETTNNRMEMLAAINALESLSKPSVITVVTDSAYVKGGITEWLFGWKRNGWRTSTRKPVKNEDLWRRLDEAAATDQMGMGQGPRGTPRKRKGRRIGPPGHGAFQALSEA